MPPTLSLSRQTCCIAGCTNSYANTASSGETIQFYRFPTRPFYLERRNVWISAVRKTRGDDDWEPNHNSRICSRHFVGDRKSDNPRNPNYNPSVFPQPQKQRSPCRKPEIVSQPQLQRKRTRAPASQGRRRPLKRRKACAFELQSTSAKNCEDYNQPTASPGSPTIEFDGKNQVETCEMGTMTSLEVREVGTMMPFKDWDVPRRVKTRHIGTVTYLQPGELPCRPFAFFCVSDGRNASTQTWCKYISVQSAQTRTAYAAAPPPHCRSRVAVSNAVVGTDQKSLCFAGAQSTASHGRSLVAVSNATEGPDHKSVGFPGAQSAAAASCGRPLVTFNNAAVGPDLKSVCFVGAQSMHQDDKSMQCLCAVTADMFALLMSIIPNTRTLHDISKADRLTLFLMKLKTGLSYGSLAALFGIHHTTVARCFLSILNALFDKTRSWIKWQHSADVLSKVPEYFKLHYPNCKIIIDCTEARVAQPAPVEIQDFYTCSKGTFSAKFLFGVAPNGALTFVRSADDRGSLLDEFTAVASSMDPIDVLPHRPSAKSASLSQSHEILVKPPPSNGECSNSDRAAAVYSVHGVHMYVDRMIHRLKFFNILNLPLSSDLQDKIDRIVHVICILANLQGSILKKQ
ncbi:uncharacterized protein [Dermacentor albipictus]|uniref:uncharacterized protein n=1 Tax=Dermacentor albipictus TaxID=60249 RepID=UPI0031FC0B84